MIINNNSTPKVGIPNQANKGDVINSKIVILR